MRIFISTIVLHLIVSYAFSQSSLCQRNKQLYLGSEVYASNTNLRSDTIDVLNYHIKLDMTNIANQEISGRCDVEFKSLLGLNSTISLDLLQLSVDSIIQNGSILNYNYNDTLLVIQLTNTMTVNEISTVRVYYHGSPQGDPTGWGGFYFTGNFAYNLGVGFGADPHNYGRVWHPCFDNFVERSTYEIDVLCAGGLRSSCNGNFSGDSVIQGDTISQKWILTDPIPTYLACVAVAPFEVIYQSYNGILGNVPIELYAPISDTAQLSASFVHLKDAMTAFENSYGAYRWGKVGYSLVPFNAGAMEHATNIAYPNYAADGTTQSERLMAHELAHHWWGNLATCKTQEDMWINEGMASYSESLFLEHVYGYDTYIEEVRKNHLSCIRYNHVKEEGHRAVSGVPHQYTYGDHVYNQGAMVAHNMRGYLGDQLFFEGLTDVLENNQFTDISSADYRDALSSYTSMDLTPFFDAWVFNPGWAQFSIDSFPYVENNGEYEVNVHIKQRLDAAPNYHSDVPIEITFKDMSWNDHVVQVIVNGRESTHSVVVPFEPVYATLNQAHKLCLGTTDDQYIIKSNGNIITQNTLMTLITTAVSDSAYVKIEHNWVAPDEIKTPGLKYQLSDYRYWRIDGLIKGTIDLEATILYDGNQGGGYLDSTLVSVTEDSLHLFYRSGAEDDWQEYPYYTKNVLGSATNGLGIIQIDSLLFGEYTFANDKFDAITGVKLIDNQSSRLKLFPNPNKGTFKIELDSFKGLEKNLYVYDIKGIKVHHEKFSGDSKDISIPNLEDGMYIFKVVSATDSVLGKFLVQQTK